MFAINNKYMFILLCVIVITIQLTNGKQNETSTQPPGNLSLTSLLSDFMPPEDPCAPYDPPLPDFSGPDKRVSTVKCDEYVWQLQLQTLKDKRKKECLKLKPLSIKGGEHTKPGEFPNDGALGWKHKYGGYKFMCGACVISPKFVLTAAHCSSSAPDDTLYDLVPKIVRLGTSNLIESVHDELDPSWLRILEDEDERSNIRHEHDANIIKIIVHPDFKSPKRYFDIALMELENQLVFSGGIQPACLWVNKDEMYSEKAMIKGWGVQDTKIDSKTSPELLKAEVDIIDFATCGKLLGSTCNRNFCGLHDDQLCAGKLTGEVDTCRGDSGGPLLMKFPRPITTQDNMYYVIGVTSFGIGCGVPDLPGVYTKVASFADWIEGHVWPSQ